jgi:hypothetical protein
LDNKEPFEPSASTHELTDDDLRNLVLRAFHGDKAAGDELVPVVYQRIDQTLRTSVLRDCSSEFQADAIASISEVVWKALPRIADDRLVEHPWAYVMAVVEYAITKMKIDDFSDSTGLNVLKDVEDAQNWAVEDRVVFQITVQDFERNLLQARKRKLSPLFWRGSQPGIQCRQSWRADFQGISGCKGNGSGASKEQRSGHRASCTEWRGPLRTDSQGGNER